MDYSKTKRACYFAYLAMSSVFSLPPLLFVTFQEMYGVSYTLLGTLILVNFTTQLTIDLVFSFFSEKFNITKTVRLMPLLTSLGLFIYALTPVILPDYAYIGLLTGTVIFSVASGLCEVLISPIISAVPSEHPERDMSMLHSLFAWGVVSVVLISTVFLRIFGTENWMYLILFFAVLPLIACVFFCASPIPVIEVAHDEGKEKKRGIGVALCVACIFFGSAAENVMTNWISGYMENALTIPKEYGDIIGMAVYALLLGLHRTVYGKRGGNIWRVLFFGMAGAAVCYLIVGFTSSAIIALPVCVITGYCTSMLWPGSLILMEENIPRPGVAAYALMAAGGDMGAAIAPQLMGIIVDSVAGSKWAIGISAASAIAADQLGMRVGMIIISLFPIIGVIWLLIIKKKFGLKTGRAD